MGFGPAPAVRMALQRAGLTINDIGLNEINEAFAAQCLACAKDLEMDLTAQRQWRRHRHRPPAGRHRHPPGADPDQRDAPSQGALRQRLDVHRRRHGVGGHL